MQKTTTKLSYNILLVAVFAFPAICVVLMLLYVMANDSNHTGLEFLGIIVPLSISMLLAAWLLCFKKLKPAAPAIAANLAAIVFFLLIDHYNIMVQYDRWLERGMPPSVININVY